MPAESTASEIWRRFRLGGELRPLVCLAASLATGGAFAGLAIAIAWLTGMFRPDPFPMRSAASPTERYMLIGFGHATAS